jgi:hypothetical protein
MSVATDEDVFTILTEDFDIACEIEDLVCPGEVAKYVATKKCCGYVLLIGEFCVNWLRTAHVSPFSHCTECGKVVPKACMGIDLFLITPL